MQKVYPTLRITDYEKSKSFYVDGLGFQIEKEHRFAPHLPVFMTISRDGLSLYPFTTRRGLSGGRFGFSLRPGRGRLVC